MVVIVETADGTYNIDIGDITQMTNDERTTALHDAMIAEGLDPTEMYLLYGEARD